MYNLNIVLDDQSRIALSKAIKKSIHLLNYDILYQYHNKHHAHIVASNAKFFGYSYGSVTCDAADILYYIGLCHDIVYRGSSTHLLQRKNPYANHPQWVQKLVNKNIISNTPAETASANVSVALLKYYGFCRKDLLMRIKSAIELTCIGDENFAARMHWRNTDPLSVCLISADLYNSASSVQHVMEETLKLGLEVDQTHIKKQLGLFFKSYKKYGLNSVSLDVLSKISLGFFDNIVFVGNNMQAGHPILQHAATATYNRLKEIVKQPKSYVETFQNVNIDDIIRLYH